MKVFGRRHEQTYMVKMVLGCTFKELERASLMDGRCMDEGVGTIAFV